MHRSPRPAPALAALAGLAFALAACGSDALPPTAVPVTQGAAAPATAAACPAQSPGATSDSLTETVALTATADGLRYGDVKAGTGAVVQKGENLTVQYTGWLSSGTVFDSSRSSGRTPFSFVIGATPPNVIQGWDEGLLSMHVGGKRRLVIPPSLAYGAQGQGCIPPNATLTFDVELISAAAPTPSAGPSPT